MGNDVIVSLLFHRKIRKAIGMMTSSFIQTEISLHQFLLHQPTAEVGQVIGVIEEHARTAKEQVNSVAFSQSQGGAQGNDIQTLLSRWLSISITNIVAVYLQKNGQVSGIVRSKSREIEMVNPR